MIKLLVIADDFTGALDTGVQFSKNGISTLVKILSEPSSFEEPWTEYMCEILVLDIESRHVSPKKAAELVSQVTKRALENGILYIYKKTDSTLRGNIGSELTALLKAMEMQELIFIPAFPKADRVTVNGEHFVNEIPLCQTEFAKDPFNPVNSSRVKDIIREQSEVHTREIHLGEYEKLWMQSTEKETISIVDAESIADLEHLGRILAKTGKLRCLAGCAGFAEMLPHLLSLKKSSQEEPASFGNTLLISGSLNTVARRQVQYAQQFCGYKRMEFPLERMLLADERELRKIADELLADCRDSEKIAVEVPDYNPSAHKLAKMDTALRDLPSKIVSSIGAVTKEILCRGRADVLIVFGGDTLMGIMRELHCDVMQPITEIETGVVLARLYSDVYRLSIITKAGGLGKEDVILSIGRYMQESMVDRKGHKQIRRKL